MEQTSQTNGPKKSGVAIFVIFLVVVAVLWIVNSWNGQEGGEKERAQMVSAGQPTYTNEVSAAYREKAVTEPVKLPGGVLDAELKAFKAYEVKMEKGIYSPSELIVAKGGRVQISMIAVDADYDVMFAAPLGVYLNVKQGQEAVFGFDAAGDKVGEYAFTCKDTCPADSAMQGKLVIK